MLKINELNSYLKNKGVPEDSYSINEVNDESLCIIEENKKWHIFYSERGLRTEEYCYQDEHLAILYFIHRLSKMLKFSFEWKKQTVACMKLLIMVSKFLSCWSHHKLRLQRPMAARNHYRYLQYDSYDSLGTGMQLEQRRWRKPPTNPLLPLRPNRHPTRDCQ